jgi:hypothetical protein
VAVDVAAVRADFAENRWGDDDAKTTPGLSGILRIPQARISSACAALHDSDYSRVDAFAPLATLFLSEGIVKVLHGGAELLEALQLDFGWYFVNLIDSSAFQDRITHSVGDAETNVGLGNMPHWLSQAWSAVLKHSDIQGPTAKLLARFGFSFRDGTVDKALFANASTPLWDIAIASACLQSHIQCLRCPFYDHHRGGILRFPLLVPPWYSVCLACKQSGTAAAGSHFPSDCLY